MASAATQAAQSAVQGYQSLGSDVALQKSNDQYGVGDSQTRLSALKGIVGNLQSSVEAVDPSVTGRTSGTFTTEGQRQALVSKEQAPILGSLNKQQGALTSEQGDLTQKQGLASQMASALLGDDKQKYQRLLDTYNQSAAQDTADEQRRQADQQSQQWAQQFAESQRQFNQTLAANKASSAAKSSAAGGQQQIISQLNSALSNAAGRDGYVSPQSYAAGKRDWLSQGLSSAAFDSTFGAYRNPYAEDAKNGAKRSKADYAVG